MCIRDSSQVAALRENASLRELNQKFAASLGIDSAVLASLEHSDLPFSMPHSTFTGGGSAQQFVNDVLTSRMMHRRSTAAATKLWRIWQFVRHCCVQPSRR